MNVFISFRHVQNPQLSITVRLLKELRIKFLRGRAKLNAIWMWNRIQVLRYLSFSLALHRGRMRIWFQFNYFIHHPLHTSLFAVYYCVVDQIEFLWWDTWAFYNVDIPRIQWIQWNLKLFFFSKREFISFLCSYLLKINQCNTKKRLQQCYFKSRK